MPEATTLNPSSAALHDAPVRGAYWSLALLLGINLFNYVDRQVLSAVESKIELTFKVTQTQMGYAATAFLLSYMIISPIFGWLADRMSRWLLVAIGVILWSLASGGTGLAATFGMLLLTRCFVGVGEAAYGPVAPTILADLYPVKSRGRILAWFYLAIPVGSALGYVVGGKLYDHFHDWRPAFYAVMPPGIILGVLCIFMKDPKRGQAEEGPTVKRAKFADYLTLLRNRSYVLDTLGMAAMTFALGGIAFWMPKYVVQRLEQDGHPMTLGKVNLVFGAISAGGGLVATLLGGITGDLLRKKYSGSYFLVSGIAMLVGFPLLLGMLYVPFPFAWVLLSAAVFCLFFNTGPTNTALANVTHPAIRPTAFAVNIFVIHLFGDAASPSLVGRIADAYASANPNHGLNVAFTVVSFFILIGGVLWLWGARYLAVDTALAHQPLAALHHPTYLQPAPERPASPGV